VKCEFDSLILSICCNQFRGLITTVEVLLYETVKSFIMIDNNISEVSETSAVVNLNAYVTSIAENFFDYLLFNLHLISIYMNNQLHYYHMISAMLDANKAAVKNQLKECKTLLKLIN